MGYRGTVHQDYGRIPQSSAQALDCSAYEQPPEVAALTVGAAQLSRLQRRSLGNPVGTRERTSAGVDADRRTDGAAAHPGERRRTDPLLTRHRCSGQRAGCFGRHQELRLVVNLPPERARRWLRRLGRQGCGTVGRLGAGWKAFRGCLRVPSARTPGSSRRSCGRRCA